MAKIGIPREALESSGGLQYVLIASFEDDIVESVTGGVAVIKTGVTFNKYVPNKKSSNIANTWGSAVETGQSSDEQVATLVFSKMSSAKLAEIEQICYDNLLVIAVDYNELGLVCGAGEGLNVTSNAYGTGTAKTDLNGYTLTLSGSEVKHAPMLDSSAIAALTVA